MNYICKLYVKIFEYLSVVLLPFAFIISLIHYMLVFTYYFAFTEEDIDCQELIITLYKWKKFYSIIYKPLMNLNKIKCSYDFNYNLEIKT